MIVQIVDGTNTRQLFISQARLVYRKSPTYDPTLTLALDVRPNDPKYVRVEIGLTGVVHFITREEDAKS